MKEEGDSKPEWEMVFRSISDPAMVLDLEHRILAINPATAKTLGLKEEDLIGKVCYEVFHHSNKPPECCPYEILKETKTPDTENMEVEAVGGTYSVTVAPIFDDAGRLIKAVHIARDLSQQKEIETELVDSEKRYRNLVENMHELVAELDSDGTIKFANRTFTDITGYEPEELVGTNFFSHVHEDDLDATMGHCKLLKEKGEPIRNCEYRFKKKDGSDVYIISNGDPIKDEDGNLTGILQVSFDITQRKKAEEEIKKHLEELAIMLKASQSLARTLDLDAVLQTSIDEAVKITGLGTGAIYLNEGEKKGLCLWATTPPLPPGFPDELRNVPLEDHPHIRQAIATKKTVIMDDTATADLTPAEREVTEIRELRTVLYVPLITQGEVVGVYIVGSVKEPTVVTAEMVDLCNTLANQTATAIQNSKLVEEIKISLESLKASEAKNMALIDAIPDMMFRLKEDGTFLEYIPSKGSRTLIHPEEFLGKKLADVMPADVAEPAMELAQKSLESRKEQDFKYQLEVEGDLRDYEARIVRSGENEVLAIIRDITEQKRLEKENLEAKDRIIEEMERHRAYVFELADRLRNPLQIMIGFQELLAEEDLSKEERKKILDYIKDSGKDLEEGIKKLT